MIIKPVFLIIYILFYFKPKTTQIEKIIFLVQKLVLITFERLLANKNHLTITFHTALILKVRTPPPPSTQSVTFNNYIKSRFSDNKYIFQFKHTRQIYKIVYFLSKNQF